MPAAAHKIIHVDMDAFFAAVEQRDRPELRGRPVVVGGDPDSRGVVATCSYEARRFGVHSAMPAAHARRLCPDAVFLRPRFEAYRQVSVQVQAIFRDYTPLVEPLSLDEAYLDVSACRRERGSAQRIARAIKARILAETGLTASAGVSYNKFLAKLASDMDKPDGLTVVLPGEGEALVARLPVGRFHGIGPATEARMHALGIRTGADLRRCAPAQLQAEFGSAAGWYGTIARGEDPRPVVSHRERKSLGSETTFDRDLRRSGEMQAALRELLAEVCAGLRAKGLAAQTLTLKVKYADFEQVTRSQSLPLPFQREAEVASWLPALLARTDAGQRPVRLLGVTASRLHAAAGQEGPRQLPLAFDRVASAFE